MKKIIIIPLLFVALMLGTQQMYAQDVPPPPSGHGETSDQTPGGGAPIGGGLLILLGLAGAYGGVKVYYTRKNLVKE